MPAGRHGPSVHTAEETLRCAPLSPSGRQSCTEKETPGGLEPRAHSRQSSPLRPRSSTFRSAWAPASSPGAAGLCQRHTRFRGAETTAVLVSSLHHMTGPGANREKGSPAGPPSDRRSGEWAFRLATLLSDRPPSSSRSGRGRQVRQRTFWP